MEKFKAFGFETLRVDGQDVEAIFEAIEQLKQSTLPSPKCIVLDTVKGQGVKGVEQIEAHHHRRPTPDHQDILNQAVDQLREELEVGS